MTDIIIGIVIFVIVALAGMYIYKSRKKGIKCIGCPNCASCHSSSKSKSDCDCACEENDIDCHCG